MRFRLAALTMMVGLLGAFLVSAPQASARPAIHCLDKSGARYVKKVSPRRCAAYGPAGDFARGVNLKRIKWRKWGGRSAKGRAIECGFHLPCSRIRAKVKAFRPRRACGGGRTYTRLRVRTRHGRTVVRLPRCRRPA
jgi:hypothetical protein